jgi:hypothetical protein
LGLFSKQRVGEVFTREGGSRGADLARYRQFEIDTSTVVAEAHLSANTTECTHAIDNVQSDMSGLCPDEQAYDEQHYACADHHQQQPEPNSGTIAMAVGFSRLRSALAVEARRRERRGSCIARQVHSDPISVSKSMSMINATMLPNRLTMLIKRRY